VDSYVARASPWRLFVWARECDYGSLAEGSTRPLVPSPPSNEIGVRAGDDVPGAIVAGFRTPLASLGLHRANSLLLGSTCPASNRRRCYQVTYPATLAPRARG